MDGHIELRQTYMLLPKDVQSLCDRYQHILMIFFLSLLFESVLQIPIHCKAISLTSSFINASIVERPSLRLVMTALYPKLRKNKQLRTGVSLIISNIRLTPYCSTAKKFLAMNKLEQSYVWCFEAVLNF